jgi:hypothetical protein
VYELAFSYLENSLTFWQRQRVRAHLRFCHDCTRYFDQLRKTIALLRRRPAQPPPADMEGRLIAAMQGSQLTGRRDRDGSDGIPPTGAR